MPVQERRTAGQLPVPPPLESVEEVAGIGSWTWRASDGSTAWSAGMSRLCGMPATARLLSTDEAYAPLHPEDRQRVSDAVQQALRTGREVVEHRICRPSGDIWVRSTLVVEPGPDGTPTWVRGVVQDRTSQQALRRAIQEELGVATALLDALAVGYAYTEDGSMLRVNAAMCAMTGFPAAELVGTRPPYPFWHPDTLEHLEAERRRVLREHGGETAVMFRRKDGGPLPVALSSGPVHNTDGTIRGWVTVFRDLTEQLQREAALAASEEQARLMFAVSPVGLARSDMQGRWTVVNEALCRLTGYSADELLGLGWTELTHPDDLEDNGPVAAALLAGEVDRAELDKRYVCKDGSVVWVSVTAAVQRDADGTPLGVLVSMVDVTERQAKTQMLSQQANTDGLTGLPNRRAWDATLRDLVDAGQPLAVGILDLDHFKLYNDTLGHAAGDGLLRHASATWAARLARLCPGAVIARLGGEEFAVALPTGDRFAAERVLDDLAHLLPDGQTASAGLTVLEEFDDESTVLARADAALYQAKRAGRARVHTLLG